ncbi:MAG: hypothetical protein FWE10_03020 [Rikenellaceae bacterium]|nr:hypothetical protein [Rikenellaceae bacterium]MCL2693132.1 hypothetical protein [Rikenellaceae bacterium]
MKKLLFDSCLAFLVGLFVVSCTHSPPEQDHVFDESSLTATGRAFMDAVQTRSDWAADWRQLSKAGTPLPNEAIAFGILGINESYYAIPVVVGNEIVSVVFYRTVYADADDRVGEMQSPEIIMRDRIDDNLFAKRFMNTGFYEHWTEKGYDLSVELTPMPEVEAVYSAEESSATTRSGSAGGRVRVYFNCYYRYDPWYTDEYYARLHMNYIVILAVDSMWEPFMDFRYLCCENQWFGTVFPPYVGIYAFAGPESMDTAVMYYREFARLATIEAYSEFFS